MTLKDWLLTIAFQLQDAEPNHEFTRYPIAQLLAAYNAAMGIASANRPDLFTDYEVMKLQPGRYQDARACGCTNIFDVLEQTDAHGGIIKEIKGARKTNTTNKRNWNKPSCLNTPKSESGYTVDTANIDPNMNGRFTIKPPVPCGVDAYVRIKCVKQPCMLDESQVNEYFDANSKLNTAAWHYVMGIMLQGDRFTQNSASQSQYNLSTFFTLLDIEMKQEERYESPDKAER